MDLSKGYMVLDIETTGLDHIHDRIVEVGVGLALPGKDLKVQSWLISDWADKITPEAAAVHGIEPWEAGWLGMSMEAVLETVERVCGEGLPIVAHNGHWFDWRFLDRAWSLVRPLDDHKYNALRDLDIWIDTAALYKGQRLGWTPTPDERHWDYALRVLNERVYGLRYNLIEACTQLGVPIDPNDQMHRTSADVKYTGRVFEKMLSLGVQIDGVLA